MKAMREHFETEQWRHTARKRLVALAVAIAIFQQVAAQVHTRYLLLSKRKTSLM